MRWLVIIMLFLGTSVSAQSVDQRKLAECITEANEILEFADNWRQAAKTTGTLSTVSDISSVFHSRQLREVLGDTFKKLQANEEKDKILEFMELADDEIFLRMLLIDDMVKEAFQTPDAHTKMSEYIVQCSTNYGGEFYTLQNEIDDLKIELSKSNRKYEETIKKHETEIRNLKVRHTADARSQLDPYIKRIDTLCNWMKIQKQDDIMKKQVIVYGIKFDLCD